ncbi:MAG: FAD-dependent oxidoreductase [Leptospiraceae bacterium]|nr:FAD-dependent oxidoreductase [Leptospiraceae bacterium]MDW7975414.1 FAD-dependent oxidoreductase [Leptospiraceae bacterium]
MDKKHIVVAGSGFAGLESAFVIRYLFRHNKDKIKITIVSNEENFLFRPNTIYIPFGTDPKELEIPLKEVLPKHNIDFIVDPVEGVEPKESKLYTKNHKIDFDYLVIATGAAMRPEEVPGLKEYANTIWTSQDMLNLGKSLNQAIERAKNNQNTHILFLVPPNNKCSGPLYEMVMMIDTHLRREKVRNKIEMTWTTYEESYIQAFGPRLDEVVIQEFIERNIKGHKMYVVKEILSNKVIYQNGEEIPYDVLISFPPYIASVFYKNLPSDDRGFIETNFEDRSVKGFNNIFAPGDAGDFPVKQAFLAFLQADAVANKIFADITNNPVNNLFDPVSMCIMEQFDKATFAQVPLKLTGDKNKPVEVDQSRIDLYKVGVSPMWRVGKKFLGLYLPTRFRNADPFHAGTAWKTMEIGLHAMSSILAD